MTHLEPTPDLVAAAMRVYDTVVAADHQEPPAKDPEIRILHEAGIVRWHQAAPIRRPDGQMPPDRWVITEAGRRWLIDARWRRGINSDEETR